MCRGKKNLRIDKTGKMVHNTNEGGHGAICPKDHRQQHA